MIRVAAYENLIAGITNPLHVTPSNVHGVILIVGDKSVSMYKMTVWSKNERIPNVKSVIGRNRIFSIGAMMRLRSVRIPADKRYPHNPPDICKLETSIAVNQIANM